LVKDDAPDAGFGRGRQFASVAGDIAPLVWHCQSRSEQWDNLCLFQQPDGFPMILELADIQIKPGHQQQFDTAIQHGVANVISKAKGFAGFKINKGIESPERYLLMIFWETLENHTVDFRESPAFQEWRGIVGPFFAAPPTVEHFTLLAKSA
jgi:heme-degrading monooxygenase HmoA